MAKINLRAALGVSGALLLHLGAVAAPGTLTQTGTFTNADVYQFSLSGDGTLMAGAGKAPSTTGKAVTINPALTGSFTTIKGTTASSYPSNHSRISANGGLIGVASGNTNLLFDLITVTGGGTTLTRSGPLTATDSYDYIEQIEPDPLGRYVAYLFTDSTTQGNKGYLYTVYPSGGSAVRATRIENRNGRILDVAFSSDGTKLAMLQQGRNSVTEIFVYNVNTSTGALTERSSCTRSGFTSRGAVSFSPDGAHLYVAMAPNLLAFSATATGTITPFDTEADGGNLVAEGTMLARDTRVAVLAGLPTNAGQVAVNLYGRNIDGTLDYQGSFAPDYDFLYPGSGTPDSLCLSDDGRLGVLMYPYDDGSVSAKNRLYTFNAENVGTFTTALDTRTLTPGGQFTTMGVRQSTSMGRIVAFPNAYVFGTATIYSVEPPAAAPDTDGDGLPDSCETLDTPTIVAMNSTATNLLLPDSDGDGLLDGEEAVAVGCTSTLAMKAATNPRKRDTDGDGWLDGLEWRYPAVFPNGPLVADTGLTDADNDKLPDSIDPDPTKVDTDNDGRTDAYERAVGTNPSDPNSVPPLGNVNGDTAAGGRPVVDVADVVMLANVNVGLATPTEPANGDLNRDGVIDINDVVTLANFNVGLVKIP